jgi:L-iditol 2-dehydrogenase
MLAAVMSGQNEIDAVEIPTPSPSAGEVLIEVGANTLCGTDLRILRGEKTAGVELPVVLGHEIAGHVAAVGSGVVGYDVGTPVVVAPMIPCRRCWECRHDFTNLCVQPRIFGYALAGGMAEYVLMPADGVAAGCLIPAAKALPFDQLALVEPLAACVAGQRWCRIEPEDVVLIMGGGPIGLMHVQLARQAGARTVIVSEPSEGRRAAAQRLGAGVTVDPTSEDLARVVASASDGVGIDVGMVCIGIPALVNEALSLCRTAGRVNAFAGFSKGGGVAEIDMNLIHYKQLTLTGSANARTADFETALQLIESGQFDSEAMITHRFALADVREALGVVGRADVIKVAVIP